MQREDILDTKIKELERLCSLSVDTEKTKLESKVFKMYSFILEPQKK